MKRKIAKRLAVLLALAGLAAWLAAPAAAQDIKVGFFAPITGPVAADGASAKQSVELAVKEVNAAGGSPALGRRRGIPGPGSAPGGPPPGRS